MKILLGADPEVFAKRDSKVVSAHGMIPGTKQEPYRVEQGAVQVDGMALEFNIDPAGDEDTFVHSIDTVMAQLQAMVPDIELAPDPVAHFGAEYLKAQPREALELGCEPDFNAWTGGENVPPDADTTFRTGAGHVHVGWTENADYLGPEHGGMCQALMQQFDFFLGLPSLLFDGDSQRRELYGRAGAYRPKPYGAEYRVLSNKWLSSDRLKRWVYRASMSAVNAMNDQLVHKYGDIQSIINNSDVGAALEIIRAENLLVPEGVCTQQ